MTTVFHGTSERKWRRRAPGPLYLTTRISDAANYAYETAAIDEVAGFDPKPIVLTVDLQDLKGLDFEPDWGAYGVTETTTWKQTLTLYGSFAVAGDIETYKKKFRRLPKKTWHV